ncbi:hypothetical protein ZEAMMB73_Zm00001d005954 [Zea mays]|uniref:Uncharacterized protein n=1 Tax=Zea mays TaxID=4577 RepID=A0A1D6ERP7_MAIZE|nr:hypothetical protein ZEAMMB73_Zm00001d005954 [Zea mays]
MIVLRIESLLSCLHYSSIGSSQVIAPGSAHTSQGRRMGGSSRGSILRTHYSSQSPAVGEFRAIYFVALSLVLLCAYEANSKQEKPTTSEGKKASDEINRNGQYCIHPLQTRRCSSGVGAMRRPTATRSTPPHAHIGRRSTISGEVRDRGVALGGDLRWGLGPDIT